MPVKKQLFAPIPIRTIAMELSGLQFRVLACVSAHDRMSLATGKGQGCRASNERMRKMIGCSYARLCSTLSELVARGLLTREKFGRHTVYRVIFDEEDRLLFGNLSNHLTHSEMGGGFISTCCDRPAEKVQNLPITEKQYIPLNGVRHFEEARKESSSEEAPRAGLPNLESLCNQDVGPQLGRLERALNAGRISELLEREDWLEYVSECSEDVRLKGWASRLMEHIDDLPQSVRMRHDG